jgi:hypothetical protein
MELVDLVEGRLLGRRGTFSKPETSAMIRHICMNLFDATGSAEVMYRRIKYDRANATYKMRRCVGENGRGQL